jgi:hypothetical protein
MNPWNVTKKFINILLWLFFHIKREEPDYPQKNQRSAEFKSGIYQAKDKKRKEKK